jgi:hypothetical protein
MGNSIIFSYLTPDPKGEHLKNIELGSPPVRGSMDYSEWTKSLKSMGIHVMNSTNPVETYSSRFV